MRRWKRQADIDAPGGCPFRSGLDPKMMFPLVRDLAAEGFPVRLTCGVLGFTAQAYYVWRANGVSRRDLQDTYLTNALLDVHGGDPEFGY